MAVRIANGQGFWGDWMEAPKILVEKGEIQYLTLDYLAEITMSIMQKQMAKDPQQGYARDFVTLMKSIMPECKRKGIKVVTNAGGLNPEECRRQLLAVARSLGVEGVRVASVTGDDIRERIPEFLGQGVELRNLDSGEPIATVLDRVVSANAYIGAAPIARALDEGADIVVTGRCTDPALVLGPLLHEYRWSPTDYDKLAAGAVAGHLIECGAQAAGGNFEGGWWQVPDLAHGGFPIAEVSPDGTFIITKPQGTGGMVSFHTVTEQLLYEMGDPANYITPDVIGDLTQMEFRDVGPDQVRVTGVKGKPPTEFLKVSAAYHNGYKAVGALIYSWPAALRKAEVGGRMLLQRIKDLGLRYDDVRVDYVGHSSVHGELAPKVQGELPEVVMRAAIRGPHKQDLERFATELAPLVLGGPACSSIFGSGRPQVSEIVEYWPALVPKRLIQPDVQIEEV